MTFYNLEKLLKDKSVLESCLFVVSKAGPDENNIEGYLEDLKEFRDYEFVEKEKNSICTVEEEAMTHASIFFCDYILAHPERVVLGNVFDKGETRKTIENFISQFKAFGNDVFNLSFLGECQKDIEKAFYEYFSDILQRIDYFYRNLGAMIQFEQQIRELEKEIEDINNYISNKIPQGLTQLENAQCMLNLIEADIKNKWQAMVEKRNLEGELSRKLAELEEKETKMVSQRFSNESFFWWFDFFANKKLNYHGPQYSRICCYEEKEGKYESTNMDFREYFNVISREDESKLFQLKNNVPDDTVLWVEVFSKAIHEEEIKAKKREKSDTLKEIMLLQKELAIIEREESECKKIHKNLENIWGEETLRQSMIDKKLKHDDCTTKIMEHRERILTYRNENSEIVIEIGDEKLMIEKAMKLVEFYRINIDVYPRFEKMFSDFRNCHLGTDILSQTAYEIYERYSSMNCLNESRKEICYERNSVI